jgi:RHS repeat-associated protein
MTYPNGTVTDYVYDRRNRLKTLTHKASTAATAALLLGLSYTVDASGLRTHLSATRPNPTNPAQLLTLSTTWIYDAVNRLTQEVVSTTGVSEQRTWSYDAVGNRLRKGRNGVSTDYTYDHNDRLLTERTGNNQTDYTYDASGNLLNTKQGSTVTAEYRWDVENRMVGSTIAGKVLSYGYDPNGIRRSQETIENNIRKRTEYLVDPNQDYAQVIEEWQATGDAVGALGASTLATSYIYGDDLISQTKAAITQFYHYDGLGSVRLLSDQAAAITDRYTYAAFGEADTAFGAQWSGGSTENNYRYAGEQLDPNLGFYYLRARYMDPSAGRFLGMDCYMGSSMDPMSLHKYSYAHNYPAVATDPSGMFTLGQLMTTVNTMTTLVTNAVASYNWVFGNPDNPTVDGIPTIWDYLMSYAVRVASSQLSIAAGPNQATSVPLGSFEGHHVIPIYCCGHKSQKLAKLHRNEHRRIHTKLDRYVTFVNIAGKGIDLLVYKRPTSILRRTPLQRLGRTRAGRTAILAGLQSFYTEDGTLTSGIPSIQSVIFPPFCRQSNKHLT